MNQLLLPTIAITILAGCLGPGDEPTGGDDEQPSLIIEGTYQAKAHWDLSPVFIPAAIGDAVTSLLIDETIATLGVPGPLEGRARDALEALIGDQISSFLSLYVPESEFATKLQDVLSDVEIETRVVLDEHGHGREDVQALGFGYQGNRVRYDVGAGIAGDLEGTRLSNERVAHEPHALLIRGDELVTRALAELLTDGSNAALTKFAGSILSCEQLVTDVVGVDGLEIGVGGIDYTVTPARLENACRSITDRAGEEVVAMLRTDIGLKSGGELVFADTGDDGQADEFASDQDFGGQLTTPRVPLVFDVEVSVSATRE